MKTLNKTWLEFNELDWSKVDWDNGEWTWGRNGDLCVVYHTDSKTYDQTVYELPPALGRLITANYEGGQARIKADIRDNVSEISTIIFGDTNP